MHMHVTFAGEIEFQGFLWQVYQVVSAPLTSRFVTIANYINLGNTVRRKGKSTLRLKKLKRSV